CRATQAAVCFRADATAASARLPPAAVPGPVAELLVVLPPISVAVTAPAKKTMTASASTGSARNHGFSSRRFAPSRSVVASTVPEECAAAGRRAAGAPPGRTAGAVLRGAGWGGGPWRAGTRGGEPDATWDEPGVRRGSRSGRACGPALAGPVPAGPL